MNRLYPLVALAATFLVLFQTGTSHGQTQELSHNKCLTDIMYQEFLKENPGHEVWQLQNEKRIAEFTENYLEERKNRSAQKGSSVVKTIPVVFHIIHEGGPENISKAQCESQIVSLNEDFRRLNADTVSTPAVFKPVAADSEIEFKIATKDPYGNCTDGIVRVYSPLTNNARNNVKALSYWPSHMYLNVWVVKSIENINGTSGIVIGFAQFPGTNQNPLTDGVVLKYDFCGTTGTANSTNAGRTATHEVGHWLNLRHIWGDDNGACTGTDWVFDTPNQADANQSTCPSWPKISCNNGPNGEMFTNYMDYTRGNCQNIFSAGQAARMNAALIASVSGRSNLWSNSNLDSTGTLPGTVPTLCAPVAAFTDNKRSICEGVTINFSDGSWNGDVSTWSWSFPGGTPSSSAVPNPAVQYNTAGIYDVTLTVSNAAGTDTHTANGIIEVLSAAGQKAIPFYESFENIAFPGNDWAIENEIGNTWEQNTFAAKTGANSIYINNYLPLNPGIDAFLTPTFNLSWSTQHTMTFELAHAIRSTQSEDRLRVLVSTTCGQIWSIRYTKQGSSLATAGLVGTPFFPTAGQWATQTVNIASSSFNNKPNVRFKFEYLQHSGNNIFIDDINIDGTVGLDEAFLESLNMSVYPNPVMNAATIEFNLERSHKVYIDVVDVMGRVVNEIAETNLDAGDYQFELPADLSNGLYNVRLFLDGQPVSKKILVTR